MYLAIYVSDTVHLYSELYLVSYVSATAYLYIELYLVSNVSGIQLAMSRLQYACIINSI